MFAVLFSYFFPLVFLFLLIIILPLFYKLLNLKSSPLLLFLRYCLIFLIIGICVQLYTAASTVTVWHLWNYFQFNQFYLFFLLLSFIFIVFLSYSFSLTDSFFFNIWLLLILIFGLSLTLIANNFIILIFSLELVSLTIIVLLSLYANTGIATNNVLNYFLLNSLVSGFFYFAIFFSIFLNHYFYDYFFWLSLQSPNNLPSLFFFFIFLFKLGVAPVHVIQLSVYEKLPWYLFFFILKLYKLVLFIVFCNIIYLFQPCLTNLFYVGLFSMFTGAVQPYWSYSLRNLLFSSSIFIYGAALLLLSLGYTVLSIHFVFVYTIGSALLFLFFTYIENQLLIKLEFLNNLNIKNNALFSQLIFFAGWFLSGIPPTLFFFLKASLIQVFFSYFGIVFSLGLILVFVLATIGYFRLFKIILFDINWSNNVIQFFSDTFVSLLLTTMIIFFFSDILYSFLLNSNFLFYGISF